jgi:hypothetical protein
MAAYKADGAFDAAFGMRHSLVISNRNIPYAIAERADTRDLVVGVNVNADLFGDGHAMQGIVQIGRNGDATKPHALGILDFGAHTDAEKGSSGTDLFVDSAIASSPPAGAAGRRRWWGRSPCATTKT